MITPLFESSLGAVVSGAVLGAGGTAGSACGRPEIVDSEVGTLVSSFVSASVSVFATASLSAPPCSKGGGDGNAWTCGEGIEPGEVAGRLVGDGEGDGFTKATGSGEDFIRTGNAEGISTGRKNGSAGETVFSTAISGRGSGLGEGEAKTPACVFSFANK